MKEIPFSVVLVDCFHRSKVLEKNVLSFLIFEERFKIMIRRFQFVKMGIALVKTAVT